MPTDPRPSRTIRLAGCVAVALVGACAADEAGPSRSQTASAVTAMATSLDGIYQGTRTPDDAADCGFPAAVAYQVSGNTIEQIGGGGIAGSIDPGGRFSMNGPVMDHPISGAIRGTHLVATETSPMHLRKGHAVSALTTTCQSDIDARRTPPGAGG